MSKKCCGSFPEYVCGDCPHANAEQRASAAPTRFYRTDGNSGGNWRCEGCFMPWAIHVAPGMDCPAAPKLKPEIQQMLTSTVPVLAPRLSSSEPIVAPPRRPSTCSSCGKPWNGTRMPRGIEGMYCGTCGQQAHYA